MVLYKNNDLKLQNKLHGLVHYKKGVTCISNGHVFFHSVVLHDSIIHLFLNSADMY